MTTNKEIDMKSRTFRKLAAGIGLALLSTTAPSVKSAESAENASNSNDGTSIWEVTKNGDAVYIGGTIHILSLIHI